MQRIHVVGCCGAGKTTLARRLSEILGVPHVELDALFWAENWTPVAPECFRERVVGALSGPAWTVDGNYSKVRELIWWRADTVVWLDYPFWLVFGRLLGRTLRRVFGEEVLWSDNREDLRRSFFSRESILLFAIRSYGRRRRLYLQLSRSGQWSHLHFVQLRSPQATRKWAEELVT